MRGEELQSELWPRFMLINNQRSAERSAQISYGTPKVSRPQKNPLKGALL